MGLVDDVRKQRDSWVRRFEEQRQDEYNGPAQSGSISEEKRILENRKKVGVFDFKKKEK